MQKQCKKCNIIKDLETNFDKVPPKESKDGHRGVCRSCRNHQRSLRNKKKNNPPNQNVLNKKCFRCKENKEIYLFSLCKTNPDGYNRICKPCASEKEKIRYELKAKEIIKKTRTYYHKNKNILIKKQIEKQKYRTKHDSLYNLKRRMSRSVYGAFRKIGEQKNQRVTSIIGLDSDQLKEFIFAQIGNNDILNYHLDHIIPLSLARNKQQIEILNHYKNLRLIPITENLSKGAKLESSWQKILKELTYEIDIKNGCPVDAKLEDIEYNLEDYNDEHKKFIERYEWLGNVGANVSMVFTARHKPSKKLCGVNILGKANHASNVKDEIYIHRGATSSWAPNYTGSKMISFIRRFLIKNTDYKYIVAYADPSANERGTLYKACNFIQDPGEYGEDSEYYKGTEVRSNRYFNSTTVFKLVCKNNNIEWNKDWEKPNGKKDPTKVPQHIKELVKEYKKTFTKRKIQKKLRFRLKLR